MTAETLFREGQLAEAIDVLGAELRSNPTDARRRTFLFELLCFAGQFDRAEKQLDVLAAAGRESAMGALLYRSALRACSSWLEALLGAGHIAARRAEWSEAERMFGLACALLPASEQAALLPEVARAAARAAEARGRFAEAARYLELALEARPGEPETLDGLANLSLRLGAHERALQCLDARLASGDLEGHERADRLVKLAQAAEGAGEPARAACALEEVVHQKTQSIAEQRRQVEYTQKDLEAARMEREFHESIATEQQQLGMMDTYISQLKQQDVSQLPLDELIRHKMQVDSLKDQRAALAATLKGKRQEYTQKAQQAIKALRAQSRELLAKQIPNLTDATLADLAQYAQSVGYTEQDVEMIQLDPRATAMLHKAKLYDALQASKAEAVQKAKTAPPAVKPGASNTMPHR